ncbi:MAG TPA: lipid-binding SYLF domain-containing protein [Blastocatellia bacterium]|nr:lipid-binding SYLF domain-containing protein [Blastocatellia bacterium]
MKSSSLIEMAVIFCLVLTANAIAQSPAEKKLKSKIEQSEKAARVLRELMDRPDQGIPAELLEATECVAVFPAIAPSGFSLSGSSRRGVVSCHTFTGWSAPAYFKLDGGSFGRQVGGPSTDLVLLFMNKQGLDRLLSGKFKIGADTSAVAGPVGRQAEASTIFDFDAHILSYSRSHGVLAGLDLRGAVISPEKEGMRAVYGEGVTVKEILKENTAVGPAAVLAFPIALERL